MSTAPSPRTDKYVHPDDARMAAVRRIFEEYLVVDEDIYPGIARRLHAEGATRFAEIGGGRGPISVELAAVGVDTTNFDLDATMVTESHRPAVRADMCRLPAADGTFDSAAACNCYYFLDDPLVGLREAHRVLRPGAIFVVSSPSRWNDAELEGIDPNWGTATTFDSEDSPRLVAEVFGDVQVDAWDLVAFELPTRDAVADYLHAFNVPDWQAKAEQIDPPMTVTKRGAEIWTRR